MKYSLEAFIVGTVILYLSLAPIRCDLVKQSWHQNSKSHAGFQGFRLKTLHSMLQIFFCTFYSLQECNKSRQNEVNNYNECQFETFLTWAVYTTCVMFIALSSTCQQLSHGRAHSLGCTSQILGTLFQLWEQHNATSEDKKYYGRNKADLKVLLPTRLKKYF